MTGGLKANVYPLGDDYALFQPDDPGNWFAIKDFLLKQPETLKVTVDSQDYFPQKSSGGNEPSKKSKKKNKRSKESGGKKPKAKKDEL